VLASRLLASVLEVLGEDTDASSVECTGADPVLASPLPLGEAGAACMAASAVLAARVFEARGGASQRIGIEIDAAAAAMRSSRYLRVEGAEQRRPGAGGGLGIYRTRDGRWIYFQRLFPHHGERLLSILQCSEDEDAIAQAVAGWDGLALEEAVVAAAASCGMVRSSAEWEAHPQAKALAELPLLEIVRIGDSAPEGLPCDVSRPLEGLRVLDLTRVLAGPTCARTLAEHGADVLRIGTLKWPDNEAMMRDTGFGKRSAALDLGKREDADVLRGLLRGADVFSQGYRPGSLASLGFGPDEVAALRPGIVYVSISAFGHTGPWQGRRGFDSVVQSVSGIAQEHAGADGRPRFAPANPLDYMTGYLAAAGALAALRRRARDGGSYLVRVSLAQTGRWLASLPRVDAAQGAPDLPAERLAELMEVTETPFGRLRHLAPVVRMSETPPRWVLPSVPLDHDAPEWRNLGR
jgi:crotonobetainyl-CoA:carnitine CoA-transferase CaiB-like acyl-CoA transferase